MLGEISFFVTLVLMASLIAQVVLIDRKKSIFVTFRYSLIAEVVLDVIEKKVFFVTFWYSWPT